MGRPFRRLDNESLTLLAEELAAHRDAMSHLIESALRRNSVAAVAEALGLSRSQLYRRYPETVRAARAESGPARETQ